MIHVEKLFLSNWTLSRASLILFAQEKNYALYLLAFLRLPQ